MTVHAPLSRDELSDLIEIARCTSEPDSDFMDAGDFTDDTIAKLEQQGLIEVERAMLDGFVIVMAKILPAGETLVKGHES